MRYYKKKRSQKPFPDIGIGQLANCPYLYQTAQCKKCGVVFNIGHIACRCRKASSMSALAVIVNGQSFHSLSESRRYSKLAFLESKGLISNLELQPKFSFDTNGKHICNYIADFRFKYGGETFVEDVKGYMTPVFRLKHKMLKAFYPDVELCLVKP